MSKQGSSRKPLVIGIIAAVVILAVLLVLLLTQCTGGGEEATQSTPVQTTVEEIPTYDLYWNLDRALYEGKSEAGMSSRQQESDGYFHIRFFKDGETLELRAADRKIINAIDVNDLMGLEFDENGIIIGVIPLDDMPVEQVGWQFYVQSVGGKLLKLNSSKAFNGLEVLLDIEEDTGIYDMTGMEGEVGMSITPISGDRVIALADLGGKLTHVFVYDRSEYMRSHQGYCQHCEKDVEWFEWTKENALPGATGHYQLQNNVSGMSAQQYVLEDAKVCLDLNGMEVDGKDNARVYTLHHSGAQLAIMDTSEDQSGVLRGHSTSSDQGGVVWVRYGACYLYAGTLDASDMTSKLNGTAVEVPKGSYFYMNGGKIIGGTAKWQKNDKGNYTNGLGGAVSVRGKFVMNDGVIEGGKALGLVTAYNADGTPKTYQRGIGGNIYVQSGGVFEMNGGTIKNGTATHSGGNVYVDGTGEFTMNGGVIEGGRVTGKGRNGGNVFVTTKSTFTLKSGRITGGRTYNCGANLYLNGKVVMTGGYIGGGKVYKWGTSTLNTTESRVNVFNVNGKFYMYGGSIDGGFYAIDTNATDNNSTYIYLTTHATIYGSEKNEFDDLVLDAGGGGVTMDVGNLRDTAKIGITASSGIFTEPTLEKNLKNFISNVEGAEVCYVDGCLALGRWSCLCGNNDKGNHFGKCDGTQLFWGPLSSTTMPTTTGNYYLIKDITAKAQGSIVENGDVKIDLNGHTLTGQKNYRVYTTFNPGAKLTVTDSSEGKTGVMKSVGNGTTQGNVVWVRYGSFELYGGTLDGSGYTLYKSWEAGKDGIFGTEDDTEGGRDGGAVSMGGSTTFTMYGGTIIGNSMTPYEVTKTVKTTEVVDGEEVTVETKVTRTVGTSGGASLYVPSKSVFNMYAGEIRDGYSEDRGGNIFAKGTSVLNLYGGTIADGETTQWGGNIAMAENCVVNLSGTTVTGGKSVKNGGNIWQSGGSTVINMTGGVIENGTSSGDQGGNIFVNGTATVTGGKILGGSAKNGGSICVNSGKTVTLQNVEISGGTTTGNGGNIRVFNNAAVTLNIGEGTVLSGGKANNGGNLHMNVGTLNISGGTIEKGTATSEGGNLYLGAITTNMTGGTVTGGTAKTGGNVRVAGGTMTVNGDSALIEKGVTNNSGHGANLNVTGTFVLEAGTVRDGKSANTAGNIYTNGSGKVVIKGGKVLGGSDKNGANASTSSIYSVCAALELRGGEMDGGISIINYNNDNGVLKMSGNPVIKSATRPGLNLNWTNATGGKATHIPYVEIDEPMTEGAEVYISCSKWEIGKFTTATEESYAKYFHADDETRSIGYVDSCVALGKTYCVCGSTTDEHKAGCNGEQLFWMPWSSNSSLPTQPGNWYLYQNVKTSGQYAMTPDSTVRIDLNGKTVTDTSSRLIALATANKSGNVDLWITDTSAEQTGAMLLDYETYSGQGAIVRVCDGSDLTMIAGTLDASRVGNTHGNGGVAVCVEGGSTFKMYGGTIIGAESATAGGSVSVVGTGIMDMYGGTITGGNATNGGNIHIGKDATVNVHGGTISDGTAVSTGGNIRCTGGNLNIYGGTITGGSAGNDSTKGWGGNIEMNGLANLTIEGGTISDGTSGGNGGNIRMSADNGGAGDLTMTGGTITGGTSTKDQGGNLFIQANATITGGLIEDGTAVNGGNIATNSAGTITLKNVTIKDGTASAAAGNIRISNRTEVILNIGEGTVITGGTASTANANNANIQMNIAGTFNITGGRIDGYIRGIAGGTINLSGNPVIFGGTTNLTRNGATINVEELAEGAKIGITDPEGGVFTTETVEDYVDNFVSDSEDFVVAYDTGKNALALAKVYAECGKTEAHEAHDFCDGQLHAWVKWDVSSKTVPGTTGYWYLDEDLTVTGGQTINSGKSGTKVRLDLNGKNITVQFTGNGVAGRMYSTNGLSSGSFNLLLTNTGAADSSSIIVDDSKQQNDRGGDEGRVIWMTSGNVRTYVNNVNIDLTGAKTDLADGARETKEGIAFTVGNGRHLYLYDVDITGATEAVGSVIRIHDGGSATLHNTTIKGHTGSADGGGILVQSNTSGKVANLTLSGNTVVSGNTKRDGTAANITLQYVPNFVLAESYVGSTTAPQGIDAPVDTVILTEVTEGWFVADDTTKMIVNMEDGMKLVANDNPNYHCVCGTPNNHQEGCDGTRYLFTEWTATDSLPKTAGYYYLADDVTISTQQGGDYTGLIVIDLAGHTVDTAEGKAVRLFRVQGENAELIITDSVGGGTMINNGVYDQGMGIWVAGSKSKFTLYNATIDLSGATYKTTTDGTPNNPHGGSNIAAAGAGSETNLVSGTIKGGETAYGGGAIAITAGSAKVNIYDATIIGNENDGGYGIRAFGALYIYGGKIVGGVEFNDANDGTVSGLWLGGEVDIDEIHLTDAANDGTADDNLRLLPITITSAVEPKQPIKLYSQLAGVGVVPGENVTLDEASLDWFSGRSHAIVLKDGKLELVGGENVYCVCGSSTEEHAKGCDGAKHIWTDWTATNALPTATGNYRLTAPVNVTGQYVMEKDGTVRIDLNDQTVTDTSARMITMASTNNSGNATLWITDTSEKQEGKLKLVHSAAYNGQGGIVWVSDGSTLNLIAGTLDASEANLSNTAGGAAVCVQSEAGVFNMYGGEVIGGTAVNGAAITVDQGTMNLYGGTVTGGKASEKGGSVYVNRGGVVNMSGGTVTGGNSTANGGNFYFVDNEAFECEFNMTGGSITNGNATSNGGNVWFGNYNEMNLSGGTISGGIYGSQGGNIYLSGVLNMSGGTISGGLKGTNNNHVSSNIAITAVGVLNMTGGTVGGRIATTTKSTSSEANLSGKISITGGNAFTLGNSLPVSIGKLEEGAVLRFRLGSNASYTLNAAEGYTLTNDDVACITAFYHLSVNGSYVSTAATVTLDTTNNCIVISYPAG